VRLWLIIAGLLGAGTVASYTIARGKSTVTERSVMAGLRVMLLAVIIVCLLQPSLILSTVVPQQNFVGILIDDSQSMLLTDENGISRSSFVNDAFTSDESELVRQLSDRFALRFFRFSDVAGRIDSPAELTYEGTHTNLARALDVAREELSGVPLSGLVMITDGADNDNQPLAESLVSLQAAGVPVFTVGVGEETIAPDIELGRIEMPRAVLEGSSLTVDAVITQMGFGSSTVPLIVEDELRIIAEETVELGPDREPVVARIYFELPYSSPTR
jgi:hypothetical protein